MFKYYALVDLIRLKQELIICMRMSIFNRRKSTCSQVSQWCFWSDFTQVNEAWTNNAMHWGYLTSIFIFVPWKDIGYIIMFYVLDGKAGFAGEKAKR